MAQVLITGAGPTGLVSALWLTAQGISVRIIDKAEASVTTSRALAIHARTLELYRQMNLTDSVLQHAKRACATNIWADATPAARIPFQDVASDKTRYPGVYMFPQYEHERVLEERLKECGVEVERRVELKGFVDCGSHVEVKLGHADEREEVCEVQYILGCDGGASSVRHTLDIQFSGATNPSVFYVADIEGSGPTFNGEVHIDLSESDFLIVFPLDQNGHMRLVGVVSDDRADHPENLTFSDVSHHAINALKMTIDSVNWFSTYRVHHRVADHFRQGRAFLIGDAAHIHSPTGGQGMNTGIGDAINLAWKLASVLKNQADDSLLDTYEAERRPFAQLLVDTTDTAFKHVTSPSWTAGLIRKWILPYLLPTVMRIGPVPKLIFSRLSQLLLNYRQGPLAGSGVGGVSGGDRMPWVVAGGVDNYVSLKEMRWQVHVYGEPKEELVKWSEEKKIKLEVFEWEEKCQSAGLTRDVVYLVRPDMYLALVDAFGLPDSIEKYLSAHGIRLN